MEWKDFIEQEKKKDYFIKLMDFVNKEYETYKCYPKYEQIFYAFERTSLANTKVVILGQDPYHEENQAHGLAFSVLCDKLPPSLVNIYKEMEEDLGIKINQDGNLTYLADQGVLLLNTSLSVREHEANSHSKHGWEKFTDNCLKLLNEIDKPIVFILWGSNAISKKKYLSNPNHLILTSPHPSPLSSYRGFFGSHPFSKTNEFLKLHHEKEIIWNKSK